MAGEAPSPGNLAADAELARSAWSLYVRGAEIAQIAEALKRTPTEVAGWIAGRVPTDSEIAFERRMESYRTQLRKLYAEEPSAPQGRKVAILSQINRLENLIEALETRHGRAAASPTGQARQLPPLYSDLSVIKKATTSAGLRQCRYLDEVAVRVSASPRVDQTLNVNWLREKAVRDCSGCPEMRKEKRCSTCHRLLDEGVTRCPTHHKAPLETLAQPFKWCLTVPEKTVWDAMREMRDQLPEGFSAPAFYGQMYMADRSVPVYEEIIEIERRQQAGKRHLQDLVNMQENGHNTPGIRAEIRESIRMGNQWDIELLDAKIRAGLIVGKQRPGQSQVVNIGQVIGQQQNANIAITGSAKERLADAMRRDPNKIPAMLKTIAALKALASGEKKEDVIDGVVREDAVDRPDRAAQRKGRRRKSADDLAGRVGKARGARAPDGDAKAASA